MKINTLLAIVLSSLVITAYCGYRLLKERDLIYSQESHIIDWTDYSCHAWVHGVDEPRAIRCYWEYDGGHVTYVDLNKFVWSMSTEYVEFSRTPIE